MELPAEPEAASPAAFAPRPGALLRSGPGRETRLALDEDGRAFVLKRFLGGRRAEGRAAREDALLRELLARGLPVVEPLASGRRPGESRLLLRAVRHAETLAELLRRAGPEERRRRGRELAELVAGLHAAGYHHRDLYLEHLLVEAESGRLLLIDCSRARWRKRTRRRWFVKDLAALHHSAPPEVGTRERLRFLADYLDRRGILRRRERRAFARKVRSKAARMAAHRPRHGQSFELPAELRPAAGEQGP